MCWNTLCRRGTIYVSIFQYAQSFQHKQNPFWVCSNGKLLCTSPEVLCPPFRHSNEVVYSQLLFVSVIKYFCVDVKQNRFNPGDVNHRYHAEHFSSVSLWNDLFICRSLRDVNRKRDQRLSEALKKSHWKSQGIESLLDNSTHRWLKGSNRLLKFKTKFRQHFQFLALFINQN